MSAAELTSETRGDELIITCTGDWLSGREVPDTEAVSALVTRQNNLKSVTLDAEGVEAWDSALINLAHQLYRQFGEQLSVAARLPEGAQQLLELAQAVPPVSAGAGSSSGLGAFFKGLNPLNLSARMGAETFATLEFIGALLTAGLRAAVGRSRMRTSDVLRFSYQTGPNALPIISLTSILVGVILGYLGAVQLLQFGAGVYVANLVTVGVLREMGALMTAVIIAGRTGAAYAAQLGTMGVNEEIDAIEILGISPMEFLVLPRVLAVLIMVPLLTLYANVLGILGGGLVASGLGISPLQYITQLQESLLISYILIGLIKAVVFGLLIGIAGCRAGLRAGRDSEGVGKATTTAVVISLIYLIVADAAINILCQLAGI